MKSAIAWVMVLGAAGFSGVAKADNWNFYYSSGVNSNASSGPGNSYTFASTGGVNITAYGYTNAGVATPIFDKYTAPGYQNGLSESGIGLTSDINHEINNTGYVELNLANIANGMIVTLSLGSVQAPESYNVYTSNTLGGTGPESGGAYTPLFLNQTLNQVTNQAFVTFTKTSAFQYIAVEESATNSANVLVSTLSTATPEPGYYALLFLGMAGLAATAIRRERAARAKQAQSV